MIFKCRFLILAVFCLQITGCNNTLNKTELANNGRIIKNDASGNDQLAVISFEPSMPAKLDLGEKLNIEIYYELDSLKKAAIWVRPFVNGKRALGYSAHHLSIVENNINNPNLVAGWFYFDKPKQINEIRVFMKDLDTNKIVKIISYSISAKWGDEKESISNSCGK
jgi:hypothetical protein